MYEYQAKVLRWVDGDTVVLLIDLGFWISTTQTFRLSGVDTPERGKPGYMEALERVGALAPPGTVHHVTTYKPDKYGRWLCNIWLPDGGSLSAALILDGLAKPYFGGTK